MKIRTLCCLGLAVALGLASPAPSALAQSQGQPMWSGLYLGGHVGYGWTDLIPDREIREDGRDLPDLSGALGGLHVGYNWQIQQLVLGIEADVTLSDMSWSGTRGGIAFEVEGPSMATVRARLGYAFGPFLPFVTGGYAFAIDDAKIKAMGLSEKYGKRWKGWVIGGGVEWAASRHWLVRGEVLHYQFTSEIPDGSCNRYDTNPACDLDARSTVVRAAVSYKLN
ncbi:MAG: porin family protein [Hyphomicrobiaceae bacterium]|nr:porin family protein [Hyphomicrobiaceae bacterium]